VEAKKYDKSDDKSLAAEFIKQYDNCIYEDPTKTFDFDDNYIEQLRHYINNPSELNKKKISAVLNLLNRRNIYIFLKKQEGNNAKGQDAEYF